MKRCGKGSPGRLYGRGTNPRVTCWKVPYIGQERGKLLEVNPVSAINTDEEKSGKRPAEAPATAYGTFPPAFSVVHLEFLAIGRLNPVLCLDAIPQVGQIIFIKKLFPIQLLLTYEDMLQSSTSAIHSQPGGCRRIPYIGSERKNSVRKTGERYKHCEEKSGSVGLRPVEIPPFYRI